jgi:GTP-binding protein
LGGGGRGGGGRGGGGGARRKPSECVDFDSDDVGRKSGGGKGRGKGGDKRKKKEKQNFEEAPMVMMMDDESQSGFEDYEDAFDGAGEDEDDFDAMGERQLELADQGRGATVKHVEFVQACASLAGCPKPTLPEIAVIGRSNVGKSSLVNMLTNRKSLAKTSKNPGKTQTINHYRMTTGEGKFYLVDLPGYGFANAPEHLREKWAEFTREYLLKRESLITVLLLIDSTIKPQRLDLECLDWLGEAGVPVTIVFTKVDKRKKIATGKRVNPQENVEIFCREVSQYWDELPPMLYTSSANGEGKRDVLNHIATLRQFFKKPLREADALAFGGDAPEPEPAAPEPVASRDDEDDDDEIEDFKDFDDEPDDDWN